MQNPAGIADLLGRGYKGDAAVGRVRLDEAWRALQLEVRTLETSISLGLLTTAAIADVVTAAAMRVLRNDDGTEEESVAVDDWRETRKVADATKDVYFTAAELRRLQPVAAPTSGSVKYS